LIAAIGQDPNSPPIFIGRGVEFVAENDGLLYFTVNHWEVTNARGAFRTTVSVDRNYRGDVNSGNTGGAPSQGKEKTVLVYANQQWTDTGIDVEPNMTFQITAEGEIEISNRTFARPEGNESAKVRGSIYPLPEAGVGALIGKIRYRDGRDSNLILVGPQGSPASEAGEYGRLFLGINDDYLRDNKGSFKVVIRW
jgi:large exoprotein involved in heme utilization and adhesion